MRGTPLVYSLWSPRFGRSGRRCWTVELLLTKHRSAVCFNHERDPWCSQGFLRDHGMAKVSPRVSVDSGDRRFRRSLTRWDTKSTLFFGPVCYTTPSNVCCLMRLFGNATSDGLAVDPTRQRNTGLCTPLLCAGCILISQPFWKGWSRTTCRLYVQCPMCRRRRHPRNAMSARRRRHTF